MRFTESPDFSGVAWVAFQDIFGFKLSKEPGPKVIYGQFRHFWAQSPVTSDWIVLALQPVEIGFLFPQDGAIVRGGSPITVAGFAGAVEETALDEVQINLGTGTFEPVVGLQEWSAVWLVPLFDEDTPKTLAARAIAGQDTATAQVTVTVTQLAVSITSPQEGEQIPGQTQVTVEGKASSILGGAPLDSITVNLAGSDTLATGLESWSVDWNVPGVTEDLLTLIRATAWAGGESASDTVTVTITPSL
jgi:hypothetical protein